jgi:hypothetical protein
MPTRSIRATRKSARSPRLSFRSIVGMHVLAGITYVDEADAALELLQVHGPVVRATRQGIVIARVPTGDEFCLPPDLSAFTSAPPGTYALRSSDDVVVDPDLLSTWRVVRPATSGSVH